MSAKELAPWLERCEWPLQPMGLRATAAVLMHINSFTAALVPSDCGTRRAQKWGGLPFDVDVTHLLPSDAEVIEDDVLGVPDDAAQVEPEGHRTQERHERGESLVGSPPNSPVMLFSYLAGGAQVRAIFSPEDKPARTSLC